MTPRDRGALECCFYRRSESRWVWWPWSPECRWGGAVRAGAHTGGVGSAVCAGLGWLGEDATMSMVTLDGPQRVPHPRWAWPELGCATPKVVGLARSQFWSHSRRCCRLEVQVGCLQHSRAGQKSQCHTQGGGQRLSVWQWDTVAVSSQTQTRSHAHVPSNTPLSQGQLRGDPQESKVSQSCQSWQLLPERNPPPFTV